jgi:RNA polymerase sigma factor (sigma-70 family)
MFKTDSRSVGEIFTRNKSDLMECLARRVGRDSALDLLQETFARLLRGSAIEGALDPDAYVRTVALNLARDFSRRQACEAKRFTAAEISPEVAGAELSPFEHYEVGEKTRLLYAAIEALPPKCRQVFIMRRFHDLSQEDIAKRLGISRNMVEKHLRLALERCRAALE